jgi:hypothetical protein
MNRKALWITGVALLGVAAVAAIAVVSVRHGGAAGAQASPPAASAPAGPRPAVAGWQVVSESVPDPASATGADGEVSVDVPPSWTVLPGRSSTGTYAEAQAEFGVGYCGNGSFAAFLGEYGDPSPQPAQGANNVLQDALKDFGYTRFRPQVQLAAPVQLTGGYQDFKATVTMTLPPRTDPNFACDAPSAIIHVVVRTEHGATFAMVVGADQGLTVDAPAADVDKVAASVRATS